MAQTTPAANMQETADTAARETKRAAEAAKESAHGAKSGVARTLSDATSMAEAEADKRVRAAAGRAADEVERSADAASDAADDFPDGSIPNEALNRVSGFLEDTARGLRDTDLAQVTGEVRRFARRNPLAFVAGSAVVGFAAARLLRAAESDHSWDDGDEFYGASHDTSEFDSRNDWTSPDAAPRTSETPLEDTRHPVTSAAPATGGRSA